MVSTERTRLSNEQERIVGWGLPSKIPNMFEFIDLPTGKQELPVWVKGSKVYWGAYYQNSPRLELKTWRYDDPRWELPEHNFKDPVYTEERPRYFVAKHPDGRAKHLYCRNPLRYMTNLKKWKGYAPHPTKPGISDYTKPLYDEYAAWCNSAEGEGGFGNSTWKIKLSDERGEAELRGPWHTSPPEGYTECSSSATVLCITEELWLKIVATYHPWHKVARVTLYGVTTLDLVHSDWPLPKQWLPKDHPVWRHDLNPHPYLRST